MAFDEPIDPRDHAQITLLDSAVNRPFQTFDGVYLHKTLSQQAAALFHSLVCNHCFNNGNKRTAVMALDIFMTANHREMAKDTAESNLKRLVMKAFSLALHLRSTTMQYFSNY